MTAAAQTARVPVGTTPRLEFQLNNRNNQPVLFMGDAPQALVLVVQNSGTQELSLLSRGKQPASIELRFRPGSLALKDPVTLLPPEAADATAGWTLTQRTEEDGTLTLALQGPAAGGTLKPGQSLRFVLDKCLADTRGGTRAIRAQLRWWLSTPGGSAVEGSRQHHLSVLYLDQGTLDSRFNSHLEQYKKDQDALALQLKQQTTGPVDSQKLLADVAALQKLVTDLQKEVSDLKKMPAGTENPLPLRVFVAGDAAVMVSSDKGVKSTTTMMIGIKNLEPPGGRPVTFRQSSRITFDFGRDEPWGLYSSQDAPAFAIDGFAGMDEGITDGKVVWSYKGSFDIRPSFGLNLKVANLASTMPPGTAYVKMTYEDLVFEGKPFNGTLWLPIERRNDYHANPTQMIVNGDVHVRNNGKLILNKLAYAPDNKDPNQADISLDGDQLVLKAPSGIRLESDAGKVTLANDEIWIRHKDGHELKLTKDWGHFQHKSGRRVVVTSEHVQLWHSDYNEIYVRDDNVEIANKSGRRVNLIREQGLSYVGNPGHLVPRGTIVMWSKSSKPKVLDQASELDPQTGIPKGWALCDGDNGTPNLKDKFILAASSLSESDKDKPGDSHHHHIPELSGHTTSSGEHGHPTPSGWYARGLDDGKWAGADTGGNWSGIPVSGGHEHSITTDSCDRCDTHDVGPLKPPSYSLCFIMKL